MTKKYKFRLSETNFLRFTDKELKNLKDVTYVNDGGKGKIIPVKRDFDGQVYDIIMPLELIEEADD